MSKPRRRHDASRLAFGETVRHSALEGASCRSGSPYVSGRTRHWLKFKNPGAPAVKRDAEEDWER